MVDWVKGSKIAQSEHPYLTYKPGRNSERVGKINYDTFLDQLGFKSGGIRAENMRKKFIDVFKAHHVGHKYARINAGEEGFKNMVSEFLKVHGTKFWGKTHRSHLSQSDAMIGFLAPRDVNRADSRYIVHELLIEIF